MKEIKEIKPVGAVITKNKRGRPIQKLWRAIEASFERTKLKSNEQQIKRSLFNAKDKNN